MEDLSDETACGELVEPAEERGLELIFIPFLINVISYSGLPCKTNGLQGQSQRRWAAPGNQSFSSENDR
jgi:hypothetical protein